MLCCSSILCLSPFSSKQQDIKQASKVYLIYIFFIFVIAKHKKIEHLNKQEKQAQANVIKEIKNNIRLRRINKMPRKGVCWSDCSMSKRCGKKKKKSVTTSFEL